MHSTTKLPVDAVLAIRPADADDTHDLVRLAALDSAAVPQGRVLLGLVDGSLHAAVAIESGVAVADPFRHTAELVGLLQARAALLRCAPRATGSPGRRVPSESQRLRARVTRPA